MVLSCGGGLRTTDYGEKPALSGIQDRHSASSSEPKMPKACGTLTAFEP